MSKSRLNIKSNCYVVFKVWYPIYFVNIVLVVRWIWLIYLSSVLNYEISWLKHTQTDRRRAIVHRSMDLWCFEFILTKGLVQRFDREFQTTISILSILNRIECNFINILRTIFHSLIFKLPPFIRPNQINRRLNNFC